MQKILGPSEVNSCEKCDKSFDQKVHLQRYIQSDHENIRYPCNKCNKSIDQKANLQRHMKTHVSRKLRVLLLRQTFGQMKNLPNMKQVILGTC